MSKLRFLKTFLERPAETGAVTPSSGHLAELITDVIDLSRAGVVVELGPGTGVFTEVILRKIGDETTFFALELNPQFAAATRSRCPAAIVHEGCARELRRYLDEHGVPGANVIISGLPWAAFPEELQDDLLSSVADALEPGGELLTFAYVTGTVLPAGKRFRRKLDDCFDGVQSTRVVWRNLPPAFVYRARRA